MLEKAGDFGGEVLLTVTAADGGVLAIRVSARGLLAIVRDGAEASPARWRREEMGACVAEFARLAGVVPAPADSPASPTGGRETEQA